MRRPTPLGDPPVYDVFDASGRVTERVTLSREARVVGLGEASVYVVRTDDLALETLERYPRSD